MRRTIALLSLAALTAAGCSSSGGDAPQQGGKISGKLTVDAASSLTEAFGTLQKQFEKAHPGTHITFDFGASDDLATQINNWQPVDVFAAASTSTMAEVKSAVRPTDFVTNKLEIATPPSNPAKITSVHNLAKPGVKVAVCDPSVPCGAVAQTVFGNAKIHVKPAANETDVKSVVATVESGEVDAGMVYVTDVRAAGSKVHGVPIPDNLNSTTTYQIAALKNAPNAAAADAFIRLVLSEAGRQVLTTAGFGRV